MDMKQKKLLKLLITAVCLIALYALCIIMDQTITATSRLYMLITLKRIASSPSLSISTFAIFAFPLNSSDSSSISGPTILHGPHQDAQKSTRTGTSEDNTSASKFSFVK